MGFKIYIFPIYIWRVSSILYLYPGKKQERYRSSASSPVLSPAYYSIVPQYPRFAFFYLRNSIIGAPGDVLLNSMREKNEVAALDQSTPPPSPSPLKRFVFEYLLALSPLLPKKKPQSPNMRTYTFAFLDRSRNGRYALTYLPNAMIGK